MNHHEIELMLSAKGVKPTSNRILVMRELLGATHPISLAELESQLDFSMDKASIFRVLELFADKELVHVIEDGSRSLKYELCEADEHHSAADEHVHFYCTACRNTFCFKDVNVPVVAMPAGFTPQAFNYMVKGLCPNCSKAIE